MNKLMMIIAVVFLVSTSVNAQNSLNGAWLATEIVVTGGDEAGIYTDIQSIIIFSEDLVLLHANTNGVVEYIEKTMDKNKKDYNFWKLISNDE